MAIDGSLLILDEMWHTFILFTKEYTKFCYTNFGIFIHHSPTTFSEKKEVKMKMKNDGKNYVQNRINVTKMQYEHVYDILGEETLKTWYDYFHSNYTATKIKELYI